MKCRYISGLNGLHHFMKALTLVHIALESSVTQVANRRNLILGVGAASALSACGGGGGGSVTPTSPPPPPPPPSLVIPATNDALLLDTLQKSFNYFWNLADPTHGLIPDRSATGSVISIAACGFGLTANCIGASRGYVSRAQAANRTVIALRWLLTAQQGPQTTGTIGYKGFFYHFLDATTGLRTWNSELSSMDTALLLMGVLTVGAYFAGTDAIEGEIRTLSQQIYDRVDWTFLLRPSGRIGHGWMPESGYLTAEWSGFNEAMMVYILALGSTTFAAPASSYANWTASYDLTYGTYMGQTYLGFPALFVQQYNPVWIDFRGIADAYMRGKGFDYFENSKRATLAQREYARQNPQAFTGYGSDLWGFTACDGPADLNITLNGVARSFKTYAARGPAPSSGFDDGTIAPTAAISSINFTPGESYQVMTTIRDRYGSDVIGTYGYMDAFNPSFVSPATPSSGRISASAGWVGPDTLGIDQGPIVAMIENYASGLIWTLTKTIAPIKRGLLAAGFQATTSTGSWINS